MIDAGTLDVCGIPVKLSGIAVPEKDDQIRGNAKRALQDIVGNGSVSCSEFGNQPPGMELASCQLGPGGDIGELLVKAGFAIACPNAPVYLPAERDARERHIGIWQSVPAPALKCP